MSSTLFPISWYWKCLSVYVDCKILSYGLCVRYVRLSFFLEDIFIDLHNVIKLLACNFQIKYRILISTYLGVKYKIYVSLNSFKEKILLLPWGFTTIVVVVECICWIPNTLHVLNYFLKKGLKGVTNEKWGGSRSWQVFEMVPDRGDRCLFIF